MLESLGLDSTADIVVLCVAAAVGGSLLGILADGIMGERGFGVLGNGLLIDCGMAAAFFALNHRLGGIHATSPLVIAVVEFCGATAFLLICGLLKNVLLR